MILLWALLLAILLTAFGMLADWMKESGRRDVQRRNDRALGRQVRSDAPCLVAALYPRPLPALGWCYRMSAPS